MKKLLLVAAAGAGLYFILSKKTTNPETAISKTENTIPPLRELSDQEAKNYLAQNADLRTAFGNDLEKAKNHWLTWAYEKEFVFGGRPNPYLD